MSPIDSFIAGIILCGILYGLLKGPISLLLPSIAITLAFPLLKYLQNSLLPESLRNPAGIAAFWCISYILIFGISGLLSKKADKKIHKKFPKGYWFIGMFCGAAASSLIIFITCMLLTPVLQGPLNLKPGQSVVLDLCMRWHHDNPGYMEENLLGGENFEKLKETLEKLNQLKKLQTEALEQESGNYQGQQIPEIDSTQLKDLYEKLKELKSQMQQEEKNSNTLGSDLNNYSPSDLKQYEVDFLQKLEQYKPQTQEEQEALKTMTEQISP
jgi:uncharacterized membrane protein required for colicin V production